MLLDKIVNAPSKILLDVEYLKKSDLPLLIYGAGVCAERLCPLLKRNNINIDHFVVDKNYYVSGKYFENHPVEQIDDVLNRYHKVNVIIAIENYFDKIVELSHNPKISYCISIDIAAFEFDFADYYNTVKEHSAELEKFYLQLTDEHSRNLMIAFINTKISKNPEELVRLNVKNEEQYFPEFLQLSENGVLVDCGAYDGDTVLSFINKTHGKYSKIYAFEPDKRNIEKLKKNTAQYDNIEIIEKGCFSRKDTMYFQDGNGETSFISRQGNIKIEVDAVDNIVSGKVTLLKMDIEGSELEALKGARNTIIANTPCLAVSLYHRPEDFYTIPQYVYSLNNSYKFYLRHYGGFSYELVLYAIPEK